MTAMTVHLLRPYSSEALASESLEYAANEVYNNYNPIVLTAVLYFSVAIESKCVSKYRGQSLNCFGE